MGKACRYRPSLFCKGWDGDQLLLPKDSKGLNKDVVGRVSACLRKIGCSCVLDESQKHGSQQVCK